MVAGNQTRIAFVQQKPGSRRTINTKIKTGSGTNVVTEVSITTPSTQTESMEKAGVPLQSMEERLAAYKKAKDEKALLKLSQIPETRQLRSRVSTRQLTKDTITRRITTKISTKITSKSQTLIDFIHRDKNEKQESTTTPSQPDDEVEDDDEESPAGVEVIATDSEGKSTPNEETQCTKPITNIKPAATETSPRTTADQEDEKPVTEDSTSTTSNSNKDNDDDDENDIHPLARTVVKASPRKSIGVIHTEEPSENKHNDKVYKSSSTLSKIPLNPTIQEPIAKALLPLPSHMDVLFSNFKALENILNFSKRQGQLCFYHKMKKHVELQSSRNFEIKHLAQFKTILPEAYKFTAAPCIFEGVKTRSILIEPVELKDNVEGKFIPQEDKRRELFTTRLYDHVKQQHQKFLSSTNPPRTDTYPHSWHPDFDLESVAPIEEGEIPLLKPAVVDILNVNLKDLGSRRDLLQRTKKEKTPVTPSSDEKDKTTVAVGEPANVDPDSPATKPLSKLEQLKERIRLKQLERKETEQKTATPEEKRQALIASRLPAVFDLIRFKRVDVLPIKTLTEQVVKSSRMPVSEAEGRESLEMLAKAIPEWCSVFSLGDGGRYFKVLRDDEKGTKIIHDEKALRARLVSKSMSSM
ncbi:replication licensing factor Cdt1 [Haplosporangium sp. Z 27]|nr:replication licensing factor Cdt1 [Haplosporangium sp. Z 27]